MGKNARVRAARRIAGPTLDPVGDMTYATGEVSNYFGTKRRCIQAAALLTQTADLLGHRVRPRAVALAAASPNGTDLVLGERANDAFANGSVTDPEFADWNGAGHVVVTLDDPAYLFDPTIAQIAARVGVAPFAFVTALEDPSPTNGRWGFNMEGVRLRYFLVPEDITWRQDYDYAWKYYADTARDLADLIRKRR